MLLNLTRTVADTANPAAMDSQALADSACHRNRSQRASSSIRGERASLLIPKNMVLGKKATNAGTASATVEEK